MDTYIQKYIQHTLSSTFPL